MRRLIALLGVVVVILGSVAAFNWWVDPLGHVYRGRDVLRAAAQARPPCLIASDLVGGPSYIEFKEDIARRRAARTIALGSSRVLKLRSHPGELDFANMGVPQLDPEQILATVRRLSSRQPTSEPLTLYLGVEFFWFNPAFRPYEFDPSLRSEAEYLLSRATLEDSVREVRSHRSALRHGWRRLDVDGRCVLGRGTPALVWRPDGSRVFSFELQPGLYRPPTAHFTSDIDELRFGVYAGWRDGFDERQLRALDEILGIAQERDWNVVGFAPPDTSRYVRLFSGAPRTSGAWRRYVTEVPALFRRHGFRYLHLEDVASVPCAQTDFVDDGFHTTQPCSDRLRARLDAAAAAGPLTARGSPRLRPAAVAVGDSITAGALAPVPYTELLVDMREAEVVNQGEPGDTSEDVLARLDAALATGAPTAIVFAGTNDVYYGWPAARSLRALDAIATRLQDAGRRAVLVGPLPRSDAARVGLLALRSGIRELASRRGAAFIDPWSAFEDSRRPGRIRPGLASDGVHPGERGTRLLALLIARGLGWHTPGG